GVAAHRAPPSNSTPIPVAAAMATISVTGANRAANGRPNIPDCIASSFTSTAGPTTMNTNRGTSGTIVRLDATNASASEHTASTTASAAMTATPKTKCAPTCSNTFGGTNTCSAAAAAASITRYAAACRKSWRATSQNTSHLDRP